VALTLKKIQSNDTLTAQLITPFSALPPELTGALDCPDFREKNILGKFMDLFQKKKIASDKSVDKTKHKKKGFFKRLFGK
jgi:hypothetical protein